MPIIRAISIRQPYANWIALGEKTIETRNWNSNVRGPLLIVSCKKPDIAPAGFALAVVTLADCRPMRPSDEEAACCGYLPRLYAWILEDIKRIKKPFPVKGKLGFYEVKYDKCNL